MGKKGFHPRRVKGCSQNHRKTPRVGWPWHPKFPCQPFGAESGAEATEQRLGSGCAKALDFFQSLLSVSQTGPLPTSPHSPLSRSPQPWAVSALLRGPLAPPVPHLTSPASLSQSVFLTSLSLSPIFFF